MFLNIYCMRLSREQAHKVFLIDSHLVNSFQIPPFISIQHFLAPFRILVEVVAAAPSFLHFVVYVRHFSLIN